MLCFLSNLRLYPEQEVGIFVAQNTANPAIVYDITNAFFDRYVAPIERTVKSSDSNPVRPHPAIPGLYTQLTRNQSGVAKINKILASTKVRTSPTGAIWIGEQEFQPITPLEFKSDRGVNAVFGLDDK